jgi:amidohydrolase
MRLTPSRILMLSLITASPVAAHAATAEQVTAAVRQVTPAVIAWRRDIHEHPELGNREFRTSAVIARELQRLGVEVRKGVAGTGVVGVLRGARAGRTIALRADMDALPVKEATGLPFASKVTTSYGGATVPVMHACGHDAHVAMLLGAARVLAGMRSEIAGTVLFVFQPAEEGPPAGEEGGAPRMMKEGVFADPRPDAVFGIHIYPDNSGTLRFRPGPLMAAPDSIAIKLKGRQTHGALPWLGVDIISLGAEIVQAMNQLAARQVDPTSAPTIITLATIHAGNRGNIIPEDLEMTGTLRTFDPKERAQTIHKITDRVNALAKTYGATAQVSISEEGLVNRNDPALTRALTPALFRAAGEQNVVADAPVLTGSEDFPYFTQDIPGLYVLLGARPPGISAAKAAPNHSPRFDIDEAAMSVGVAAHVNVALDFLQGR